MGRKARMRKLLREEDVEELLEQADEMPEVQKKPTAKAETGEEPAAKVLELQKTAGNRAVGAALQRWGGPMLAQQQAQWPKDPQLLLDGKPIPFEAYSESPSRTTTSGGPSSGSRTPTADQFTGPGDIHVVIKWGDWVPDLYKGALEGKHYDTVEIVIPTKDGKGIRIILKDVTLTGYTIGQSSGDAPSVQLSLTFQKREFAQTPPPKR